MAGLNKLQLQVFGRKIYNYVPFISTWKTTAASESIVLPYDVSGEYTGLIDWGDGTTSVNSYANRSHTYTSAGTYTVTITGKIRGFNFNGATGNAIKIYDIQQWGSLQLVGGSDTGSRFFYQCQNMVVTATDILDTSLMTGAFSMFHNCYKLTSVPSINDWDLSHFNTMAGCFTNAYIFNQNLTLNIPSMVSLIQMFYEARLFNGTINFTTSSSLTSLNQMFRSAFVFNNVINISNTSGVTDWNLFLSNARVFNQIPSLDTSGATSMIQMFQSTWAFNQDLSGLDFSSVTNMSNFMISETNLQYSETNYDALLIKLDADGQSGVTLGMGTVKYTAAGATARANLVAKGWTITDGGQI